MVGQITGSPGRGLKRIFATALTETKSYDAEGVGAIRFEGNNVYKWVKYNSGTGTVAAVAGNVAYYMNAANDGYANSEVTSDLSDSDDVGAGVLMAVIPTGEYGWVQIRGMATITTALAGGADGNALTAAGATDGTLDVSAAVTDHVCAVAIDADEEEILCMFPF